MMSTSTPPDTPADALYTVDRPWKQTRIFHVINWYKSNDLSPSNHSQLFKSSNDEPQCAVQYNTFQI